LVPLSEEEVFLAVEAETFLAEALLLLAEMAVLPVVVADMLFRLGEEEVFLVVEAETFLAEPLLLLAEMAVILVVVVDTLFRLGEEVIFLVVEAEAFLAEALLLLAEVAAFWRRGGSGLTPGGDGYNFGVVSSDIDFGF
jgi:hypothetical protein